MAPLDDADSPDTFDRLAGFSRERGYGGMSLDSSGPDGFSREPDRLRQEESRSEYSTGSSIVIAPAGGAG